MAKKKKFNSDAIRRKRETAKSAKTVNPFEYKVGLCVKRFLAQVTLQSNLDQGQNGIKNLREQIL